MRYLTAAGGTFLAPASAPTVNLEVAGHARVISLPFLLTCSFVFSEDNIYSGFRCLWMAAAFTIKPCFLLRLTLLWSLPLSWFLEIPPDLTLLVP